MNKRIIEAITLLVLMFSGVGIAGVKNIAHRGGSQLAPENTRSAFLNAVALSADYLELDIQLSSDDSMMIMHDNTVDRTTNGTGFVSNLTYAQLRVLDAGSKFSAAFAGEKIPTFSEVLEIAKNSKTNIGIVAEIKTTNATAVQKTVAMIQKYGMQSRMIVSSFDINQIAAVKTLDSTINVQLFASAQETIVDQIKNIHGAWIGSNIATKYLIDYAHSKGILFNIWTINGASQMISFIDMGVDGITTDDPKTLKVVSDSTAPSDVTLNTATVNQTKITISWNPATDAESGIVGYEIYRGTSSAPTTLHASVGDTTQFVDETFIEGTKLYYRVKAKNLAQLKSANYSNELSATTEIDNVKPELAFVTSYGDTSTVYVEYSERVDSTSATTSANYSIDKSVTVLRAVIGLDQKTIMLTTTKLSDTLYTINVKNVKDKAAASNTIVSRDQKFIHLNLHPHAVAYYALDNFSVSGTDALVVDASTNANNGAMKNGVALSEGFTGNGLQFDGVDDYVQFSSSPSFDIGANAVTVSLWTILHYLPNELPSGFGPLFDSETDNYVLYEDRGNNQLRFKVTTTGGAARPGIASSDLKKGEWIHIVGVYDGTNAMIYLNGVLKASLPLNGSIQPGQAATLGKNGSSYFSGKIDNVLVLNKVLSGAEVAELYKIAKTKTLTARLNDVETQSPSSFFLSQNYPNPFNPITTISFGVPYSSTVIISIYDILGRKISTIADKQFSPGFHTVPFNGTSLASGMYLYRMTSQALSGDQQEYENTKKLLLMK